MILNVITKLGKNTGMNYRNKNEKEGDLPSFCAV